VSSGDPPAQAGGSVVSDAAAGLACVSMLHREASLGLPCGSALSRQDGGNVVSDALSRQDGGNVVSDAGGIMKPKSPLQVGGKVVSDADVGLA